MGSRKSIIREAIERLDSLMAIGESRFQAKQAQRAASPDSGWTVSTGKIHSHTTRKVYQQHDSGLHQLGTSTARDHALSLAGRTRRRTGHPVPRGTCGCWKKRLYPAD